MGTGDRGQDDKIKIIKVCIHIYIFFFFFLDVIIIHFIKLVRLCLKKIYISQEYKIVNRDSYFNKKFEI